MKILIILCLFLGELQWGFAQVPVQSEPTIIVKIVDSIIESINKTKLIEKIVYGSVEPFSNVSGIAFLDQERREIKKLQFTYSTSQKVITYYCVNNIIQVISTPQSLYYRHNKEWFIFHFLKDKELLTLLQLQSQDEFLKNATMTLINQ